jgi:hypothetical protein
MWNRHNIAESNSTHGDDNCPNRGVKLLKVIKANGPIVHYLKDPQKVGNDKDREYQDYCDGPLGASCDVALHDEADVGIETIVLTHHFFGMLVSVCRVVDGGSND